MFSLERKVRLVLVMTIPWIIIAAVCAAIAPIMIKRYVTVGGVWHVAVALLVSAVLVYAYVKIFRTESLIVAYPLIKILAILMVLGIGVFVLSEELTWRRIAGIFLGIAAIWLLAF